MSANNAPRKKVQAEMLVGLSAVVIGVCALGVSLYETHLMREEQRLAALPLLELLRSHQIDDSDTDASRWRMSFHAENVGIGPALIRDFTVTVDGEPHRTWESAIKALIGRDIDVMYGQSSINGRTIPPERQITMFDLKDNEFAGEILQNFDRLDFAACYCSVFNDCWTTSYRTFGESVPVEACTAGDDSFSE